jgi:LacI family transcriptional regulator
VVKQGGNIREIARLCGVSTATVSRVLNNKPDVSDESRKMILDTIGRMGYTPKLTVNPTNIIGLTVEFGSTFTSSYVTGLLNAIEEAAWTRGYDLLILRNEHLRPAHSHLSQLLKRRLVSGLIVLLSRLDDRFPVHLAQEGFPHVVVSNRPEGTNYIDSDAYSGAREAMQYLIQLGHRRIGMVHATLDFLDHFERMRAYRDALSEAGLMSEDLPCLSMDGPSASGAGYQTTHTMMRRFPDVTALIVPGEGLMGVMECLRTLGLSVPGDISLIAVDDEAWMNSVSPSVTALSQRIDKIGAEAVRDLVSQIEARDQTRDPLQLVLPVSLVIRQSTGPAPRTEQHGRALALNSH